MFDLGDTVPIGVAIRNASDVLVNPSTIVVTITLPDGATVTPTPVNDAPGLYSVLYVPTQAGRHLVRWVTTGPNTAHTDSFDVAEAAPSLIVSLSEAKAFLNIDATDTEQDDELRAMLEGVTAVVESIVGPVVRRTVTTTIYPNNSLSALLPSFPILSLTSAAYVVDGSSIDLTGYTYDQGILRGPYGTVFPASPFTVTYVVGRPDLPANIRMGALEILKSQWRSQRGNDPQQQPFLVPFRAEAWLDPDRQFGVA